MTVAAFMDLALYDSRFGYYARAAQRSGRAGDFFTSVDVGPVFGELLEVQLAEMARILNSQFPFPDPFDLVEAAAGNGRLSADILRAARRAHPRFLRQHPSSPGRGRRRGPGESTGNARRGCGPPGFVDGDPARSVRRGAPCQRAAGRAAHASGGDAAGRAARDLRGGRPARFRAARHAGGRSINADAGSVPRQAWRRSRTWMDGRDQPARRRMGAGCRDTADPRVHDLHRLRSRRARALFRDARRRHAHDLRAPHDGRPRIVPEALRPGCATRANGTSRRTSISPASARRPRPRA